MKLLHVAASVMALATLVRAAPIVQSGPARVTLVELFTSEGCSSCPPAEKWLGTLKSDPGLWKNFVPVAFHVNYWDHLGWRDRLATAKFTAREYAYAKAWASASVYTPCFVRNGVEWRVANAAAVDLSPADRAVDAGRLTIAVQPNQMYRLEYLPPAGVPAGRFEISAALLGGEIVSDVRAGENRGRELRHDFVVLRMATAELKRDASGKFSATVTLAPGTDITAKRHAISAWVTPVGELVPLQAAGGWIDESMSN